MPVQSTIIKKAGSSIELPAFFIIVFYVTYAFTRPTYEPSRVSISIVSPSLMNQGTRTVAPDSTVAGFNVLVAVSPLTPGSV